MPHYRKRRNTDTWHWCKNCSNWPTSDYVEEWHDGKERPKSGELDNERLAKEKAGDCSN